MACLLLLAAVSWKELQPFGSLERHCRLQNEKELLLESCYFFGNLGNISLCGKSQRPLQNQFCRIEQLVLQKLLCKGFWWSLKGLTECVCTLFSKNDFRPSCGNVHMQKPLLPVEGDCVIFLMQSPSISRADFCMCIVQFYKVEDIFPQCFQLPINVFFCLENQVTACYSAAANLQEQKAVVHQWHCMPTPWLGVGNLNS